MTYSYHQHTTVKARYVFFSIVNWTIQVVDAFDRAKIVQWVAESKWPFQIVTNRGFQTLMKTGQPGYHILSPNCFQRCEAGVHPCMQSHCENASGIILFVNKLLYSLLSTGL